MPKTHNRKRTRDHAAYAVWDAKDPAEFDKCGVTLEALKAAQNALQGEIIMPGDTSYDAARLLSNPAFNPFPSMIVLCKTEADVGVALGMAMGARLPFTVRSGGHCTAGYSAGNGILIDVKGLETIFINVQTQRAIVGTGVNFGAFNQQLALHGLHVPGGECEDVCIGGYVQGGGIGFTSARFGMNCDNVVSMRVMLWDGAIVVCNAATNRDLFWAMCGGTGGNFGILLSVEYQLSELRDVYGYSFAWRLDLPGALDQAADVMMMLQREVMHRPAVAQDDTFQMLLVYQSIIDPKLPPLAKLVPVFMIRAMSLSNPDASGNVYHKLGAMPGAVFQFLMGGAYVKVLSTLLGYPQDQPIIAPDAGPVNEDKSSRYVARDLTLSEYRSMLDLFANHAPNSFTYAYLEFYGGAVAARPKTHNAFIHRDAHFNAVLDVFWFVPKDRAASEAFMHSWNKLIETMWNKEVYQNYPSVAVPDYALNYWGTALKGLVKTKIKYDPQKVFVFAQQVPDVLTADIDAGPVPAEIEAALAKPIDYAGGVANPRAKVGLA